MEATITPTPLELRERVIIAREAYQHGAGALEQLYAAADEYIESLRAWKKRTGRRLGIPTRAYLIRAL